MGKDSHGGISAFDQKSEGFAWSDCNFLVERLVVHVVLLVPVLDEEFDVVFGGVFQSDDAGFLPALFEFEGVELEVVGQQVESHLSHPDAVEHLVRLVEDGGIEEEAGLDDFPPSGGSDVEVEVEGVFGVGFEAEGQGSAQSLGDGLAVAGDLAEADGEEFGRVTHSHHEFEALQQVVVGSMLFLEEACWSLELVHHQVVVVNHQSLQAREGEIRGERFVVLKEEFLVKRGGRSGVAVSW